MVVSKAISYLALALLGATVFAGLAAADDAGAKARVMRENPGYFGLGISGSRIAPSTSYGGPTTFTRSSAIQWADPDDWKRLVPVRGASREEMRAQDFPALNVSLLSWMTLSQLGGNSANANDSTGWVSGSGREYAIIGLEKGTAFVEITDPVNPKLVANIPDTTSLWSDMECYGGYCYNGNESGGGLQYIDIRNIDNGVVTAAGNYKPNGLNTIHTMAINPDSGFLYLNGSNLAGGGLVAIDVRNPGAPTLAGSWSTKYVHDSQVVSYTSGPYAGREIAFCCCGGAGLRILDVTNKSSIFQVGSLAYVGTSYCHSGTLSADRKYFFVDDELDEYYGAKSSSTLYVIDVSDITKPTLVGTFTNGNNSIDHNGEWRDGFVMWGNYSSGLRVLDVRDPMNIVETGHFDTRPEDDRRDFVAVWDVWAGFPSGNVIISDMQRGLFVVDVSAAVGGGSQNYTPNSVTTLKGAYNSGTIASLSVDDGDYWVQGASYDPTDPLAVINSVLQADTNVQNTLYSSGIVTVVEKSNSVNTVFRVRAVKSNGSFSTLADNVPGSLTDVIITGNIPTPVADFIDANNGNRMRLEIRNSSSNKLAGFFRHSVDLVEWELTP